MEQYKNSAQFLGECVKGKDIGNGLFTAIFFKNFYSDISYYNMYSGIDSHRNKLCTALKVQRVHQSDMS